jgi:sarcosine oxidase subunit alpha
MWPRGWKSCTNRSSAAPRASGEAPTRRSRSLCPALRALRRAGGRRGPAGSPRRWRRRRGARVMLCDEQPNSAAACWRPRRASTAAPRRTGWRRRSPTLAQSARHAAAAHHGIRLFPAQSHRPQRAAHRSSRAPRRAAARAALAGARAPVVLATGAIERPLVFPGNDRPGIMLAGAAQTYLNRYGVQVGRRAVIVTAHDAAYRRRSTCSAPASRIAAIADVRAAAGRAAARGRARAPASMSHRHHRARHRGRLRVKRTCLGGADGVVGRAQRFDCDAVLMSGGFTPSVHLFSQSRGKLDWSDRLKAFVPGQSGRERALGRRLPRRVWSGRGARRRHRRRGRRAPEVGPSTRASPVEATLRRRWPISAPCPPDPTSPSTRPSSTGSTTSPPRIWRWPRAKASSRSSTSSATPPPAWPPIRARPRISTPWHRRAEARQVAIPKVGLTTFRMPYTPVTFGSFAGISRGDLFDPVRTTPIHDWAAAQGAVFENVGLWKRARYFPAPAKTCMRPWRANASRCAMPAASSMPRRWARSKSSARMRPSS